MRESFYIMKVDTFKDLIPDGERWLLRHRDTHFTLSAKDSKEEILDCLERMVLKYKRKSTLDARVNRLVKEECKLLYKSDHYPEHIFSRWEEEYTNLGVDHEEEVDAVVVSALRRISDPSKDIKSKARKLTLNSKYKKEETKPKAKDKKAETKVSIKKLHSNANKKTFKRLSISE